MLFGKLSLVLMVLWKVSQFVLGWDFTGVSRATGSNLTRRIEFMPDVKRHTKFSLISRAMIGTSVAALLIISFTLATFTHDKAEASRLLAAQNPVPADSEPTILYREAAKYPIEARQNGLEGTVILDIGVAADGKITDIQVFIGLPDGMTESAIEAAKKARFKPATMDGKPVSARAKMMTNFKLVRPHDDSIYEMTASLHPTISYRGQTDYTREAREKMIEGDVVLDILFGSYGNIKGIRVERGLPYGLTEEAIRVARAIRFDPAMKDGKPVSVRGKLEFGFRL
jgi:TonB family protein